MGYLGLTPTTAQQNYLNIDDISGSFDGSTTSFALQVGSVAPTPFPVTNSCLISVGGVIQEPDDTGTSGFRISGGNIVFSSAPGTGEDFFGLILAGADYLNVGANFPDGTVGTPSITFDSDTNTGIYHPSADELSFVTGGSDRVRVDSNGRLGIGTSSPGALLNTRWTGTRAGSTGVHFATSHGDSSDYTLLKVSTSEGGTDAATKFLITGEGKVGIGTASPSVNLQVQNDSSFSLIRVIASSSNLAGIDFGDAADIDRGSVRYDNATDSMAFTVNASERARIDSSGRFLVGTSTAPSAGNGQYSKFVVQGGNGTTEGDISIQRNENAANITSGENIGYINFNDNTGNTFGVIRCFADGNAQASNDFPGAFRFETTANGSGTPTEGMRITRDNEVNINDPTGVYNLDGYTNAKLFVYDVRLGGHAGTFVNNHVSYNQSNHGVLWSGCSRSASSGYVLFAATSGNGNSLNYGADYEFRLYGDGNGKCDGSWTGGGADYAEMFEWVDGNPDAEDRRGLSVVLEGNKIRAAVDGEDPIGVISANPTILGDAAWNKWTEKHLRDDFGSYVYEEHNVLEWTDEEGKEHNYEDWNIPADVVVPDDAVISTHDGNGKRFTHRAINPAYNPDREYVPREERQEWDAVGLMGKLRIRKGQVTGARWIKMRDISDTVEEWLVR